MNNAESKSTVVGAILLNITKGIYKAEYQKKQTLSVELTQKLVTTSIYAATKTSNEMNGGLFGNDEFGIAPKSYTSEENRVGWVNVPESSTLEQVMEKVAVALKAGAVIYRVLSFHPIISKDQQYAIDNGLKTIDDFANQQAMRFPENEKTVADGSANTLIADKTTGNVQYRKTFFWPTQRADEDMRDIANVYVSPELETELVGAASFSGQEIN